jgi:prevent-host-death family protein
MISVKIAEFRNQLSKYLKKVRRGDEVVITDRDTPIGRLVPYEKTIVEEPFDLIPPEKGWGNLAKMKFTPLSKNYGVVDDLLAQRKKR